MERRRWRKSDFRLITEKRRKYGRTVTHHTSKVRHDESKKKETMEGVIEGGREERRAG